MNHARSWNECPVCEECADPHTAQPADPSRTFGPGEVAEFTCPECDAVFTAVLPEPVECCY